MKKQYSYHEMISRLLKKAYPIRYYLLVSTLASIIGNLSRMGLMGFGALLILCAYGKVNGSVWFYGTAMAVCGALIAVGRYLEGVFSHKGAYGILARMRVDFYAQVDRIAPAYLIDHQMGDVMNTAVGDIEQLEFFFAHMIGPMFTVILLPVVSVVIAWRYNRLFAWILIPAYVLVSIVIPLAALKAGRRIGEKARKAQAALKSTILESVYGIRDIQIFDARRARMSQMLACNTALNKADHGLKMHRSILTSLPDFVTYAVRILIVAAGGYLAMHGAANPVGTIIVSFIASASFSSTFSLTTVVTNLLETFASAQRIFAIEDTEQMVQEAAHPIAIDHVDTIRFEDVSFTYPGTHVKVLDHASFEIHHGDQVGFIGDSGAGKSTILRLLLRFYDPEEGKILIDGVDLKDISFSSLHAQIGLMEQDTYLFDDTIAANIAIGRSNASRTEIEDAAKKAGIHDFICSLPDGYQTQMGAMNARVSGGERQRIGLARLFLKNPAVMIFDEPTSALDVLHEKEFLHTLKQAGNGRTVLMISHRMSTLSDCSRILRLDHQKLSNVI
ncbi:MAG: ABC transporter ATP-binding protein [Lactimicrobium sp.]|jgi:ATP-binding cassette subfamily C protein|uniref:ABC transporter ATP-binding protein n=1 Tax=Lactimicrobium sp. TaxID=2563780 RepID=UPI002F359F7F